MSLLIIAGALLFLMWAAYRGLSVILFAPIAALGAVMCTDPLLVAPLFTGVFMEKAAGFLKLYFPVFLLGALFGKMVELSGISRSIVSSIIKVGGNRLAVASVVLVCAVLTYGGVSLFVVVFAVYPFANELFRRNALPKRLLPATIALGAFSFTMDALPGTPQIQNIIPISFFGTDLYAAPALGGIGSLFIFAAGLLYLNWRCRCAALAGEGYGSSAMPPTPSIANDEAPLHPLLALLPLLIVGVLSKVFAGLIPQWYGAWHSFVPSAPGQAPITQEISKVASIWAVEAALVAGIFATLLCARKSLSASWSAGSATAISGALLAAMNTASEYGFGAVIAVLPGFQAISQALNHIPSPLVNEAVAVSSLAGITGSASGGLSVALAAMAGTFLQNGHAAGIPDAVLHRVASMASGGMDTLPHNGAVITLLFVTGLTHRESYGPIFAITCIKTAAVFVVIGVYHLTGFV